MTTRKITKWFNNGRRLLNTVSDLKDEDIEEWTRDYYSGTHGAVGPRYQNLGKYLKTRRRGVTREQYRTVARERMAVIDRIEAQELASRQLQARTTHDPVWRENFAQGLRTEARTYEPGVEMRLAEERLSRVQIEAVENLDMRRTRYGERRLRAPQILEEILAEADAHIAAQPQRQAESPNTQALWRHYDSDEGWGKKPKNKTKKKRHSHGSGLAGRRWMRRSPVVTRAVTRRRLSAAAAQSPLRMKSYVYITGGLAVANAINRVAQVISTNRDKSKYAVRLNYNGQIMIMKREHLRTATTAEKRADKKKHNRESPLNRDYRDALNE